MGRDRVSPRVPNEMGQFNFSGQRTRVPSLSRDGPEQPVKIRDRTWDKTRNYEVI